MSDVEEIDELIVELRKKTNEELFDMNIKLIKMLPEDTKIYMLKWVEEQLKIKEEELQEQEEELQEQEEIITCCECKSTQSHKKIKWTYITQDTDTNISLYDNVWCCDQCLKDSE